MFQIGRTFLPEKAGSQRLQTRGRQTSTTRRPRGHGESERPLRVGVGAAAPLGAAVDGRLAELQLPAGAGGVAEAQGAQAEARCHTTWSMARENACHFHRGL